MSYVMRAAVIAGFFTFYYRQRPGRCFIGPFGWERALLGTPALPKSACGAGRSAGCVYLAVITPVPTPAVI